MFISRDFRKYKSASIHFARPFIEKYRQEFETEIGIENYQKFILDVSLINCPINPFQSSAFDLGYDNSTLSTMYFNPNDKMREEQYRSIPDH